MDRLESLSDGRQLYRLRRPWRDATTHIAMAPLELLEKLAALVPAPNMHLNSLKRWPPFVRFVPCNFLPAAPDSPPLIPTFSPAAQHKTPHCDAVLPAGPGPRPLILITLVEFPIRPLILAYVLRLVWSPCAFQDQIQRGNVFQLR